MQDIEAIKEILPHRYPFLLVDRVLEMNATQVRALKNVTINEPYFAGHFPQEAVMPGVLILEGLAQAAGLLVSQGRAQLIGYLVGVDKARFRRKVIPGDQLLYEVTVTRERSGFYQIEAKASVDGELAAEAVISVVVQGEGASNL
ncbi:3-hydroxyacyl-ACP dehydratase FabZ [Candidatus Acetothermia bacterium]|nr:3-hydroxyacyl-ACP dehydratase FabZ [Candidatus Acetothermia bacterium]MBI3460344.1 3-hydroxyacyl-ACP dehydratase FabZ [Candidatus Acetothermia bacterium]MBI3659954.1 3-hydroxyacyl-ACP dehydratase FabZ [Candidatus Acetothermia bacterium]